MINNSEQSFKVFDAHSRDMYGMPHSFGKCNLLTIAGIENLVSYLKISCLQTGVVPFEIKGVFVRDNELDLQNVHESPKIEHLPFRNERNQTQHMKRKQKSLTEMPEEKKNYCLLDTPHTPAFLQSACLLSGLQRGVVLSPANISRSGPLVQVVPH